MKLKMFKGSKSQFKIVKFSNNNKKMRLFLGYPDKVEAIIEYSIT